MKKKVKNKLPDIHNGMYGKKHSEEAKRKISQATKGKSRNVGENNPAWKGDNVGMSSLHQWVRTYLPVPQLCEMCFISEPYDLANITGIYNRDFVNWKYLCRFCHMVSDGRLQSMIAERRARKPKPRL